MNSAEIFTLALGLDSPWHISDVNFKIDNNNKELHLEISFDPGAQFKDETGTLCPAYDSKQKQWRHMNFFEHKTFINAKVPRIKTTQGKVKMIDVPWARKYSGFTLLFEALAMSMIEKEMPVNKIAQLLGEDAHRFWTIFNHWINKAYQQDDPSTISKIGIDETSRRKGHNYISVAVDLDHNKVVHVVQGKDIQAVADIKDYLCEKGTDLANITQASIDLSPAFISGIGTHFPNASITFDKFHVVKLLNQAMDEVRKKEYCEHKELKGHKYTFLKNRNNLSTKKQQALSELITLLPTLGEAYRLKLLFNDLWDMPDKHSAEAFIEDWIQQASHSKIQAFIKFGRTLMGHLSGIINFVETRITNAILESINNKIQMAKRRARGYRNIDNFINMIYFLCGKLRFDYPLDSS
jgi:transposase